MAAISSTASKHNTVKQSDLDWEVKNLMISKEESASSIDFGATKVE